MVRQMVLWLALGLLIINLLGCQSVDRPETTLHLDMYPNILLPIPQQVTLNNLKSGSVQQHITIKNGDLGPLMRVLRSAVDTKLTAAKMGQDAWQLNKTFSLELSYTHPSEFDLMIGDNLVKFNVTKVLIGLNKDCMYLDTDEGIKGFNGLKLSDQFTQFMRNFTPDSSFPLPPAISSDKNIEQLPLARPGQSQIEFLPRAEPNKN